MQVLLYQSEHEGDLTISPSPFFHRFSSTAHHSHLLAGESLPICGFFPAAMCESVSSVS